MKHHHLLTILVTVLVLAGCSNAAFTPSVDKNYSIDLYHPTPHDFSRQATAVRGWQEKMREAEELDTQEEALLRTTSEPHVVEFRREIAKLEGLEPVDQLDRLNWVINDLVTYVDDYRHWEKGDKWGDPYQTLVVGGDCEDIAILKLEALRFLGWDSERLVVLVGHSSVAPTSYHALLLVELDDGAQVLLDSLEDFVLPPQMDHHFTPMYGVTATHMYLVSAGQRES